MKKQAKTCQNCEKEFIIESEDFAFYEKIKVPAPTFCPDCREQRRIAFRNERALYKRKCDLCGREVVSRISPEKPYPMYCRNCWWSDKWDALKYGRDYDFNKPFFEQFKELLFSAPHVSIFNSNMNNSEWSNQETDDKNCYLNVGGHYNEDSAYNTYELYSKDCFDNFWIFRSELCYENLNCERCYKTLFSQECNNCQEVVLSYDCRNCQNCFGCAGLRSKQYWIFNKPHAKEQYQEFLKNNSLTSRRNVLSLEKKAKEVWLSVPHRESAVIKSINCAGNFIAYSKNVKNSWNVEKVEDSKFLYIAANMKDSYDVSAYGGADLSYECASGGGAYNSRAILYCMAGDPLGKPNSSNLEYCYAVIDSNDCFGCANLRNKQYCILNKQYTKEEYQKLVAKIKEHMNEMPYISKIPKSKCQMSNQIQNPNVKTNNKTKEIVYRYGEFFPPELSPFAYNETAAQDYFPLTKEQAIESGYTWNDYESDIKYDISDEPIPDDIKDVKDDIVDKIFKCQVSAKPYKIIPMELEFYRRIGLPIPTRAPLQRHKDRIAKLLPRKLFPRQCMCAGKQSLLGSDHDRPAYTNTIEHFHKDKPCPNNIETPYAPDRPEIVYCEQCYKREVN